MSFDTKGRAIVFNMGTITLCNVSIAQGNLCWGDVGYAGGDWNSIISKEDATNNPDSEMYPCLARQVEVFD